jgi:hypothetical protein
MSVNNPIFIVGVFRSGTSLLYSLLNQHPQISLMYECNVWDFPALLKRPRFAGDWLARQEFYNQALSRHRLVWGGSLRGLESVRTPDDLYRIHSEQKGIATLWGEKSPFYSTRLKQLGRQYPNATFIFIWRNPVETYRSILLAGRTSAFFKKPGMLHRLIYHQEQLISQSAWLAKRDARVRHINYDDLVDRPEQACRSLCEFLKVKFEPAMLELAKADFSAVYDVPHQNHLRKDVIERQKFSEEIVPAAVAQKLERFHKRWQRRFGRPLAAKAAAAAQPEPGLLELLLHNTLGFGLHLGSSIKRLGFEFLPLQWLRSYRLLKNWFGANRYDSSEPLVRELANSWFTVLASFLFIFATGWVDYVTGFKVTLAFFYTLPCMVLALAVSPRWASFAAAVSAFIWSGVQLCDFPDGGSMEVLFWNTLMRFGVLQIIVSLLARIRAELKSSQA